MLEHSNCIFSNHYLRMSVHSMEDNEKLYPAVPAQVFKAALDDKESCKPTASLSHSLAFSPFLFQGGSKICPCNA